MGQAYLRERKPRSGLLFIAAALVAVIAAAAAAWIILYAQQSAGEQESGDAIVLFVSGLQRGAGAGMSASSVASYVKESRGAHRRCALVSLGGGRPDRQDVVSSGDIGAELMNELSFDIALPGRHELDFGSERRAQLDELSRTVRVLSAPRTDGLIAREHEIMTLGSYRVAFVGASIIRGAKALPEDICAGVQRAVDESRGLGATHVVLLSALGSDGEVISIEELVAATRGIDAAFDGAPRTAAKMSSVRSFDGRAVRLVCIGASGAAVGELAITADGGVFAAALTGWEGRDGAMDAALERAARRAEELAAERAASGARGLTRQTGGGCAPTSIGRLCADAIRSAAGTDIALVANSSIRADLPDGSVSFADLSAVMPFEDEIASVAASGARIVDALEFGAMRAERPADHRASGAYLQTSGLRYKVDASRRSTVETDEDGMFLRVAGRRRVSEVEVLMPDGRYAPIVFDRTYTVAAASSLLRGAEGGSSNFLGCEVAEDDICTDVQALVRYAADVLGGDLSSYSDTSIEQGR